VTANEAQALLVFQLVEAQKGLTALQNNYAELIALPADERNNALLTEVQERMKDERARVRELLDQQGAG